MYLMHHGLTGFDGEVDCNTLKYPQVNLHVLLLRHFAKITPSYFCIR